MSRRRPKHGYCASCGEALKRHSAIGSSCTISCAARAWYALKGADCGLDNEYCIQCGNAVYGRGYCDGCCAECNLLKEECDCELICHKCSDNYEDVYHRHPVGRDCTSALLDRMEVIRIPVVDGDLDLVLRRGE